MEALNQSSEKLLPAQAQSLAGSSKTSMVERSIFKEASIPSPLSPESMRKIDYDGHPKSLKKTYRHIFRQKDQLLARIRSQKYFTNGKRECGLLCWLKSAHSQHGDPPGGLGKVGRIPRSIQYAWLRQSTQLGLYRASQSPEATSEVGSASSASNVFAVIRRDSQAGGEYIIETGGKISLSINGVPVCINSRVRRFPDFAVIEADGNIFFWWRTQKALNFIPKNVRRKRPFEGSQRYENLEGELSPLKRSKISPYASSRVFSQAFMSAGKPPASSTSSKGRPLARIIPNRKKPHDNSPRGFSSTGSTLGRSLRRDSISTKRSWSEKLDQGLKRHRRARREEWDRPQKEIVEKSNPLEKLPHDPYNYRGLWDDQVMSSIGVVWDALRQNDILFAVSPLEDLQHCRKKGDTGLECKVALGPNPFIIPLTLWSEESPIVGQLGHHLLAVAQVTDRGPIKIKLMDSSPGRIAKQHIQAVIAGLIMYSGWLGKDGKRPRRVWPAIEFDECVVPEQELVNACGLNVVLNAWAEMLNISINRSRHRVKACKDGYEELAESADFLRQAIEIVDLAISGHMDTETILAFMIRYGYADFRIPLNPEDRDEASYVPQLELAPLTRNIDDIIDHVNDEVTPSRFDDSYYLDKPNQDDLRFLMKEARCNEQLASKALQDSNRDMRIARWFVPVTRNDVQKVEILVREMRCTAKEAEEALREASGNSRMAHFWVEAAWKRQEEAERAREEAQNRIQQGKQKKLERGSGLSQASAGVDFFGNESTVAVSSDNSDDEEDEEEDEEEEDEEDEEDEGDEEDEEDEGDEEEEEVGEEEVEKEEEWMGREEKEQLDKAMAESLFVSFNLGPKEEEWMGQEEKEQLERAVAESLLESSVPHSSLTSPPTAKSDFSGNETPTALSSSDDSQNES